MTDRKQAKHAIAGDSRPVKRARHVALGNGQSDSQKTQGNDTNQSGDGLRLAINGVCYDVHAAQSVVPEVAQRFTYNSTALRNLTVRRGNGEKSPTRATATRQKLPTKCKGIS